MVAVASCSRRGAWRMNVFPVCSNAATGCYLLADASVAAFTATGVHLVARSW